MIKLEHVSKYYNTSNNVALGLHDISLEFKPGEIVAIVGESGSGKSTLLNVIAGIDTYEDGEMYFNGEETSYYNNEDLEKYRKDNVGFIFQNYNLVNSYTVLQNVMLPLLLRGYTKIEAKKKAKEIIDIVGLNNRMNHKGTHLSGGEAQRVSIARAIASDSPILACDEPTGNLDSKTGAEIMDLIEKVSDGRLVLIVTHNYAEVENIATRRITLHDGELVEDKILKESRIVEKKAPIIDYDIKKKDCFDIAMKNIFATPKKTILSCLVFATVAFIISSLIGLSVFIQSEVEISSYLYENCNPARVIAYSEEGIDVAKIKDKYKDLDVVTESYLEDMPSYYAIDGYNYSGIICYQDINDEEILYGKKATADDEVMIGVPKDRLNAYVELCDTKLSPGTRYFAYASEFDEKFLVTGIYEYDTKGQSISISFANAEKRDAIVGIQCLSEYSNSPYLIVGKDNIECEIAFNLKQDKTVVKIPSNIFEACKNSQLALKVNNKEVIINSDDVIYQSSTDSNVECEYGKSALKYLQDNRQVSVYAKNSTTVESISNYMESIGYKAFIPSRISRGIDFSNIVSKISIIITTFFITLAILSLYFLSYLVLSRIYASKNRDYAIMRTLGVKKKEMSLIVYGEIAVLCVSISLFVFLVFKILSFFLYGKFWIVYQSISIGSGIVYFLLVLLFSLLMGRRFNRKLFKFSVNTTMKREALDND